MDGEPAKAVRPMSIATSNRSRLFKKVIGISIAAFGGAALGLLITSGRTSSEVLLAWLLGALVGALVGWSFVTSDPMESDALPRSYVGGRSPDDAETTVRTAFDDAAVSPPEQVAGTSRARRQG